MTLTQRLANLAALGYTAESVDLSAPNALDQFASYHEDILFGTSLRPKSDLPARIGTALVTLAVLVSPLGAVLVTSR